MEKNIEMITFDTNIHATASEKRFNYAFNVPRERITFVQAGKVQRKNEAKMSDTEKNAFINGITNFNLLPPSPLVGGNYRQMVAIHRMNHRMHSMDGPAGTQRFLTWHRIYLADLEYYIRSQIDPNFFIPYWNWVENPHIPVWLQSFLPLVYVADTETVPPQPHYDPVQVYRTPGQQRGSFLPTKQQIDDLYNIHTYTEFTVDLELLHNGVHMWVGGPMIDIRISPADPLFWLHHANIDRIWSIWQTANPNQNPNLSQPDQYMDPWPVTEPQWRTNLYSEYV